MKIEERLKELGLELPPVPPPVGNYVNFVQTGNLLYLAGKGPFSADGSKVTGKVGGEVPVEMAYQHARSIALAQIAVMKEALGDLDRVNIDPRARPSIFLEWGRDKMAEPTVTDLPGV